mmetsp:Transcript_15822/g.51654  ORF Transcript_15822/g.51654 Transcript_15822/m.51654 type:complete len:85 (-) Transcript_15822:37-291(-)|eukprot:scaffold7099_cov131-Isochrysis_galbana.AAC.3
MPPRCKCNAEQPNPGTELEHTQRAVPTTASQQCVYSETCVALVTQAVQQTQRDWPDLHAGKISTKRASARLRNWLIEEVLSHVD